MGVVYRAFDPTTGAQVAVKVLLQMHEAEDLRRLDREARITAGARHPNVVTTLDAGREGAHPFVVLELVDGESLSERLRRAGSLEPLAAARLFEALARGLQHVHDLGVIHRDIKPANVLLDRVGSPKLSDFGLARRTDLGASKLTATGVVLGTPLFMAPEQASSGRADPRSDVYGLGATLYQALTGHTPFRGADVVSVLRAVLEDEVIPPSRLRPDLPAPLERICLRCLARNPADRFASAAQLADALAAFASTIAAPGGARTRRARSRGRRLRRLAAGGFVGAAAITLAVVAIVATGGPELSTPPVVPVAAVESSRGEAPTLPARTERERLRSEAEGVEAKGWPFDDALAAWGRAAERDDAEAWVRISRLRRWRRELGLAEAALARARALDPSLRSALAEAGHVAVVVRDGQRLLDCVKALRARDPLDPDADTLAALLALAEPDREAALPRARALVAKALARAPDHLDAGLVEAIVLNELREFEATHRRLDRVLSARPDLPAALLVRARAVAREGRTEEAQQVLERLVTLDPEDPVLWEYLGNARQMRGLHEGAVRAFTRALELEPAKRFHLLLDRAHSRSRLQETQRAGKDADLYLFLARGGPPDRAAEGRAFLARAVARTAQGDLEGGRSDQQQATRLRPDHVEAWLLGVVLRLELGDAPGALLDAEKAVDLTRGRAVEALTLRARAHLALGEHAAALADVDQARALGAPTGDLRAVHARLLVRDDPARARDMATGLIEEQPKDVDGPYALAEALVALGDLTGARRLFLEVLSQSLTPRFELPRAAWTQLMTLPDPRSPEARAREAESAAATARVREREGDAGAAHRRLVVALFAQPGAARWLEIVRVARRRSSLQDWYAFALERARAALPDDPALLGAQAYARVTYGDAEGLADARAALARDPECAEALAALAVSAYSLQGLPSAQVIALVERALEADPELLEARALRAMLLLDDPARVAEALREADDVVRADPGWAAAYHYRSGARVAQAAPGATGEALADLRRAVELEPDLIVYWDALAGACDRFGDPAGAAAALTGMLAVEPRSTHLLARRAVAHERAGDALQARRDGLEALRRLPFHDHDEDREGADRIVAEARRALEAMSDPEVRAALARQ